MPALLFLKKDHFDSFSFLKEIPNLHITEADAKKKIRVRFGHSCLDIGQDLVLEKTRLLELRAKLAIWEIDVLMIDNYLDPGLLNLFFFDMDSTVIREEVIDELARKHGVYEIVASVTKQAMEGGMAFNEALKLRVKYLKGLSRDSFLSVYNLLTLNPGMETILCELPKRNTLISILSGGFSPVLEMFAQKYPISFFRANHLEEIDSIFTGEILGEIINRETKAYHLKKFAAEKLVDRENIVAVGDGANDGLMLQSAGIGIGFHAKQGLKDQILNWIDFSDMSVLLFLFR